MQEKRYALGITMRGIRKKFIRDETKQPGAVQIDYADWLMVERVNRSDLSRYVGVISLTEEPLNCQSRVRKEWS